jgi:CheY-like chemotaxis protein
VPDADDVVMRVWNSGEPIPEDILRRIFDPFFTTKEVGRGTGLGLSVAQNIVRNHGGSLTVRNEAGGVCFEIRIPASHASDEEIAEGGDEPSHEVDVHLDRARILVVDDEEPIQELFVSALPEAEVVGARDGRAAILRLEAEHWDAVVSDLKMPGGVSGLDLVEWARENRNTLVSRMIIMTGATFDGSMDGGVPGDVPVLLKPFGLADLRGRIAEVVGRDVRELMPS